MTKEQARKLAIKLFENMSDRRDYRTYMLDDDIRERWLQEWEDIIFNFFK